MAVSTRVSKAGVWLLLGILGVAAAQNAACSPKFHSCYRTRTCPKAPHDDAGAAGEEAAGTGGAGEAGAEFGGTSGGEQSPAGASGAADGGSGGVPPEVSCVPNQPVCDGDRATFCNAMGTGYEDAGTMCSSTQTCSAGICEARECAPSLRFCDGSSVRLCTENGLSSKAVESCASGRYCDVGTATCMTGMCSPGQPACDGARATTCNAEGSGYVAGGKSCAVTETCSAGQCRAHVCVPSGKFCQGQDVKECSANGLSSTALTTCGNQACVQTGASATCSGVCRPGQTQCSGNNVQTCNAAGTWGTTSACSNQACVQSGTSASCSGVCSPEAVRCSGNGVQTCSASGGWGAVSACPAVTPACAAGVCGSPPTCSELGNTCGANGTDSCCSSPPVPGGTFNRNNDGSYPATLSSFRLDRYEITVGRFRKFVAAYNQNMIPSGTGKNPNNPNDSGWSAAWNASLPVDSAALKSSVKCSSGHSNANYETWTDAVGNNEGRPINCLDWYVANAVCAWDGGRLPTEAEWNYAAAAGNEQRDYPWGSTVPGGNATLAVFGCFYGSVGTGACVDVATNIAPVGSAPAGNGKWGHADLAGGMREWVLDLYANPLAQTSCSNCSNLTGTGPRVLRGGSWGEESSLLVTSYRSYSQKFDYSTSQGARCARAE
jgi:sulfatase modifying factor 1